ncbi:unnamed protein product [Caenorhabditis auriculariae]|uniref:Metalloendopeptidase n=1 Tax=Caenorhabditis auriculariae TaxID=2777116 RepID=A0A8S1HT96_9PELO|nr:unnamed protein product [Caenorhabditis auriculariae]
MSKSAGEALRAARTSSGMDEKASTFEMRRSQENRVGTPVLSQPTNRTHRSSRIRQVAWVTVKRRQSAGLNGSKPSSWSSVTNRLPSARQIGSALSSKYTVHPNYSRRHQGSRAQPRKVLSRPLEMDTTRRWQSAASPNNRKGAPTCQCGGMNMCVPTSRGFSIGTVECPSSTRVYLAIDTLRDLIDPKEQEALRDTLSAIVQIELGDGGFSDAALGEGHNYEDQNRSISALNYHNRDILFQGDIRLSTEHLERIVDEHFNRRRRKRTAFRDVHYPKTIWKPYVPYVLHPSLGETARMSVLASFNFWQKHTCIKFQERNQEPVYLFVIGNQDGCWSTVGKDDLQGRQSMNIGPGCEHFGITSHEVSHALGLFHEQSRFDRNSHVSIIARRIPRASLLDFAIVGPKQMSTYKTPYDVGSVMHYRPTEFSTDGRSTIVAKDPNMQNTMGQLGGPSFLDIKKMNSHYQCSRSSCNETVICSNGGYQDHDNCSICRCPRGYGGPKCDEVQQSKPSKCSGNLVAGGAERRFSINMRRKKGAKTVRNCNYHITAPKGKRVQIIVEAVIGKCVQGCYEEAAEFKLSKDKSLTGARVCCPQKRSRRYLSGDNTAAVIANAAAGQTFLQFRYSIYNPRRMRFFARQSNSTYTTPTDEGPLTEFEEVEEVDPEEILKTVRAERKPEDVDEKTFSDIVMEQYLNNEDVSYFN